MLKSLRRIIQEVNSAVDLQAALDTIVDQLSAAMSSEVCSIYLANKEGAYVLMSTKGLELAAISRLLVEKGQGLVGMVAAREEPMNVHTVQAHPDHLYFKETGEERYHSFLGVPIIHNRKVLGVLVVQRVDSSSFGESEEAYLVTISAQLSGVIAHAEASGGLSAVSPKTELKFTGIAGASGVAVGRCVVVSPLADLNSVPFQKCASVTDEIAFFERGLTAVREDIKSLAAELETRLSKEENMLFDAYLGMLDDTSLGKEVIERIRNSVSAPYAWSEVILEHVNTFLSMEDPYLSERASDVRDLGSRVLAYLQESTGKKQEFPDNTILVGEEVTASMLGEIPAGKLVGIVSLSGSSNSHIAILARSMGIPTVMGTVDLPYTRIDGRELVVDGYRGAVYIDPSQALVTQYHAIALEDRLWVEGLESLKNLPCETKDNHRVALWVNTGLDDDAARSLARSAEGVGLYRTEVPFMLRDRFPSEEQQREIYREQLEVFAPHVVTMRTLDIGGDKALSYFPIEEANPFLGWRGIRVTLDHPEIFLLQIRAMLKASEGLNNLRIMLPMVTNVEELEIAKMLVYRAFDELLEEGHNVEMPPIGVMIEVPAAVYQTREFAARVDFLSVGSNDLTQYLLAVDRNNSRVADLYHSLHPAVLRALSEIVKGSHSEGVPVSICGELASDPPAALLLVAMGYDVLSMSATSLLKIKSVIRAVTLQQAEDMLLEVMKLPDTESINRYLETSFRDLGLKRLLRPDLGDDDVKL